MKLGWALPKYYEDGAAQPYRKSLELAQRAEDAGFHMISVPHHSFTPDTEDYAAPLLMLAALAVRTSTVQLATTIFILPLYPPAAVAEQLGELDRLSGGRLIFGVGTGYRDYECDGHEVEMKTRGKRMDEMLTIIRRGFETGFLQSDGPYYHIPKTVLAPMPVQKPGPPIWVGGNADAVMRRAARLGDGWISENLFMLEMMKERIATYRRCSAEAGRPPGTVTVIRNAYVATTREEAEREWLPGAAKYHLFNRANYRKAGIEMPDPDGVYARLKAGEKVGLREFIRQRAIAGTPDDCIEQIKLWEQETNCDMIHLASAPHITTDAEFEAQKRFIDLFGKQIIPAVT